MPKIYWDLPQGSPEWYALRSGIPTASEFHRIITPKTMKLSEQHRDYACRIVLGRMMNWRADSLEKIDHIRDGKTNEPMAAGMLAAMDEITLRKVGFVTTDDGRFGASPDRVVVDATERITTTVEIKCPTPPVQLRRGAYGLDDDYRCQIQGQLLVTEADKAIYYGYHPMMPPHRIEIGRDVKFMSALADALDRFFEELVRVEELARSLGVYQMFALSLQTPEMAEYRPLVQADATPPAPIDWAKWGRDPVLDEMLERTPVDDFPGDRP